MTLQDYVSHGHGVTAPVTRKRCAETHGSPTHRINSCPLATAPVATIFEHRGEAGALEPTAQRADSAGGPENRGPLRGDLYGAGVTGRFSFQKGTTPGISHFSHISSTLAWKYS